jgi:hypothetical protein
MIAPPLPLPPNLVCRDVVADGLSRQASADNLGVTYHDKTKGRDNEREPPINTASPHRPNTSYSTRTGGDHLAEHGQSGTAPCEIHRGRRNWLQSMVST